MLQDDFEDLCETLVEFLGPPAISKQHVCPESLGTEPVINALGSTAQPNDAALCTPLSQVSAQQESSTTTTNPSTLPCHGIPGLERLAVGLKILVEETSRLRLGMDRLLDLTASCANQDIVLGRQSPSSESSLRCGVDVRAQQGKKTQIQGVLGSQRTVLSSALKKGTFMKASHADTGKKICTAAVATGVAVRAAMAAHADILELALRSKRQGTGRKMSRRRNRLKYLDPIMKSHSSDSSVNIEGTQAILKTCRQPSCISDAKLPGDDDKICHSASLFSGSETTHELEGCGVRSVVSESLECKVAGSDGMGVGSKSAAGDDSVRFSAKQNENQSGSVDTVEGTGRGCSPGVGHLLLQNRPTVQSLTLCGSEIAFIHNTA